MVEVNPSEAKCGERGGIYTAQKPTTTCVFILANVILSFRRFLALGVGGSRNEICGVGHG
jgi:hypothetical protein